jgi:predicted ATPase
LHQRTGGHPLFLVAMVDELVRQGLWQTTADAGGNQGAMAVLREVIPASLRQYIEQHLERVSELDQALLEAASVAGSAFAVAAVASGVAQAPERLEARYTALARHGRFIRASGTETWPDGTVTACYQFIHALYHEVVYARVSAGQRVRLHQRIGARKEAGYGAQARQIAAELAVHFERGRDHRRAIVYLRQAADNALRRSAHADAIAHLTKALALLATLPDTPERTRQELDLQVALGPALMAIKGYAAPEVAEAYARARELCEQVGDTPQLCEVLVGLCVFYQERAELQTAHALAQQLLSLAQRLQDPIGLLWAHNALGYALRLMGEFVPARTHLEQSLALYRHHAPPTHHGFVFNPGVDSLCGLSETLYLLGYPDQALQRAQEALGLARALSHPFSLAEALSHAARMHRWHGELQAAQALEEASLALCREQGFAQALAQETVLHGWDLAARGQAAAGIAQMRQGLEALRATGAEVERPWLLTSLALAYGNAGQPEEGLALIAEALNIVDKTGKRIDEAGLYRRQGELLLARQNPEARTTGARRQLAAEAEGCFRRALAIARRQQAKTLELRAAMSLARLWQRQGKRAAALELLAPVYGWFTEGLETTDLREARALLEELS